jgi:hypothetical protein
MRNGGKLTVDLRLPDFTALVRSASFICTMKGSGTPAFLKKISEIWPLDL